jgi:hypothetical protein
MERIPLHSWEMEFSIQYHVTINSQLNDQNSIRYYIKFNIILKTWSDIVSDQPMFLSDMMGHLIILKRDVVSCHTHILKTKTNTYQKSKTICIMVNKITQYQRQLTQ